MMSDDIMYDSKEDCYMVSEERLDEFEKALKERDELAAELERVKELRDKWYDKFISKNLEYKDLTREMDRVEAERDDARKSADTQCQIRYMVVVLNIDKWISACNELSNLSGELRVLQSECIRLGYGGRDTDGNFVLKDGKNCTPE